MHRISAMTIFLSVVCAGLIQGTAFKYIEILGTKPDLLLVMTIFFSLSYTEREAIWAAVTAGLIKDIMSSSIFGSYTLSLLLVAVFLNYHQSKFYKEKASTQVLLTFGSYAVMNALILLFNLISRKGLLIPAYPFLNVTLRGALYAALLSPPVFFMLSKALRVRLASTPY